MLPADEQPLEINHRLETWCTKSRKRSFLYRKVALGWRYSSTGKANRRTQHDVPSTRQEEMCNLGGQ
jgi:hypothetical protein